MNRVGKLLGMIFIFLIVLFIVYDEKGYKFHIQNNNISFNKIEVVEKAESKVIAEIKKDLEGRGIVYKNLNIISINPDFEEPKSLRQSGGKIKKKNKNNVYTGRTSIDLGGEDMIFDVFQGLETQDDGTNENIKEQEYSNENINTIDVNNNTTVDNRMESTTIDNNNEKPVIYYPVDKFTYDKHTISLSKGVNSENIPNGSISTGANVDEYNNSITKQNTNEDNEFNIIDVQENFNSGKNTELSLTSIKKYSPYRHIFNLRKGVKKYNFTVDNINNSGINNNGLSDSMLDSLLQNEEIDINTLESENDEFLQKVFEKTKDTDVMNLIIETYLNEYQFIKAKKFIESLPEEYASKLKPSLHLRVAFNSFPLSSKNVNENLTSIIQNYSLKNEITNEDKNRYLGVLALMERNYDKFFEISTSFSSEKYITFTLKLKKYKEQISTQMGMPDYYFDTLVSLELFNQGLFQPAKVLSLYSLQQDANYILPYQILAYANFLTSSWDTSVEYLKKLVDLDPNNAEKYRFLMGIAFYRDAKYEQSVVMLSMIKNKKLSLDTQRYLINNYLKLDQKNRLISTRNKLLGYENLVASDFYTYFYETFFHPYAEGSQFQLYAFDAELANKMLRVCAITLPEEERVVCTYGTIGRNIALGQFEGIEKYLLDLVNEYPQGYLYQALGEYYVQQGDLDKAKAYLLKAVSLAQQNSEISQIKNLLKDTM